MISMIKGRLAGLNLLSHIRIGFTALAVAVIGYALADTAITLSRMEVPKRPEANAAAPRNPANAAAAGPADYSIITERNYFGSSAKPVAAGDLKFKADYGSQGGSATLQLDLLGTIADNSGRGYAIIEERDKKKQGLFKVGDSVAGATLKEVRRNAVVMNVGGKDEFLEVKSTPRESLAGPGPVPPASAVAPQRSSMGRIPGNMPAPPAAGGQAESPAIKEVRDLLAEGQAKPHFNSGKMEGFYINKIKDGSYLQKAGLEDGDIVQSVNNRKIENPNDVVWIQKAISNPADKISLQVNRKGRQLSLDVN
jgi:type II secretion system protein C